MKQMFTFVVVVVVVVVYHFVSSSLAEFSSLLELITSSVLKCNFACSLVFFVFPSFR